VRRDLIVLRRDALAGGENALRARVEAVEYQGTFVKVTLSGASDEEFIVNESEAAYFAEPLQRGDEIAASWSADQVHLLELDRAAGGAAQPYAEAEA